MLRKLVYDWAPPRLLDWARARFSGIRLTPTWPESIEGTGNDAEGWSVAARRAALGYPEGIARMKDGRALSYLPSEEPTAWLRRDPQFHHRMVQFALVAARVRRNAETTRILDYGGGFGAHALALRRMLPNLRFDYTVCELPSFCEEGRRLNPDVRFVESLAAAGGGYDLVYASGSVQYARDWRGLVRDLCAAGAGEVFLTRIPFVLSGPSLVVMQRAYGTQYPGWIYNQEEFVEAVHAVSPRRLREVFVIGRGLAVRGAKTPNVHLGMLFA